MVATGNRIMKFTGTTRRLNALSLALVAVLVSVAPAQAKILHGYLEEIAPAQSDSKSDTASAPATNSFPVSYQGNWHCVTTVTDSGIASVPNGQVMESNVQFHRTADGRILAHWTQPGWTETQATITTYSPTAARIDRTNYYVAEGMQGQWAARSRDQFTQVAGDSIIAKSYVDQYQDGLYVGRYRTTSILHKTSELAFAPQK
ncbi:MAG TPA: hypothetical protein V6C72_07120 [Chroococcales cyanobacterium]